MFKKVLPNPANEVRVEFDGRSLLVPAGLSVAAALLGHGECSCNNSAPDGDTRGPYCLMGLCFECLVEINGRPDQQACLTLVEEGMRIRRQVGSSLPNLGEERP